MIPPVAFDFATGSDDLAHALRMRCGGPADHEERRTGAVATKRCKDAPGQRRVWSIVERERETFGVGRPGDDDRTEHAALRSLERDVLRREQRAAERERARYAR